MAATTVSANRAFFNQLRKYYTWYTGGFIVFLLVLAVAEQMGLSRQYIGYAFLFYHCPVRRHWDHEPHR